MIGLLHFVLAALASPFKSKLRLEAENAVLRHQLNVLRRGLHGRVHQASELLSADIPGPANVQDGRDLGISISTRKLSSQAARLTRRWPGMKRSKSSELLDLIAIHAGEDIGEEVDGPDKMCYASCHPVKGYA